MYRVRLVDVFYNGCDGWCFVVIDIRVGDIGFEEDVGVVLDVGEVVDMVESLVEVEVVIFIFDIYF